MSPADEIAGWLAAERITGERGGNADWSVHVSREPETPDNVVTLYDTGALDPLAVDPDIRAPQVQVRVRSFDYAQAWETQEQIRAALVQPSAGLVVGATLERIMGSSRYVTIHPIGDILAIGRDDSDRHIITANYQAIRQPETGS